MRNIAYYYAAIWRITQMLARIDLQAMEGKISPSRAQRLTQVYTLHCHQLTDKYYSLANS